MAGDPHRPGVVSHVSELRGHERIADDRRCCLLGGRSRVVGMVTSSFTIARIVFPFLIAAWSSALAATLPQTVILVRHAERSGGMGTDVGISDAGRCRAEALARMLTDAGIKHIYVSEVARTQQTAQPLANKLRLGPEVVPAKDIDSLVAKVRTGGVVLVVGHSNTVPEIIKRIGGGTVQPIDDGEYDRMYVVTLTDPNHATVVTLHYAGCAQ
jgi:phosphohistidine phosphatase SixA